MSNTSSPLTIQGEEIYVGWKFQAGQLQQHYVVVCIALSSVGFETLDGGPLTGMTFTEFRKWLEPPSKNPS
jgi:hypothetical protein